MIKHLLLAVLFSISLACGRASAQNLCPVGVVSDKLICLIPQVYGSNGLVLANTQPLGVFQSTFLSSRLRPLSSAIAGQSTLLPLASPSSGITFSWDAAAKVYVRSSGSFGAILAERADTIGKQRLFLGYDYQFFAFSRVDGVSLKALPLVLTQQPDSVAVPGRTCSIDGDSKDDCGFIRDVIKTDNRIDLKIHQFTTFITFGLTNRIDVSVAIPIENVRMGVFSNATIIPNSQSFAHVFAPHAGCAFPCFQSQFSTVHNASGIGDLTLRVKGTAWKGAKAGVALGVDLRLPTGDQLNFLGSGAMGVKPFVVWSYSSRIAPHLFAGYEANGSSVIAGDPSTGSKDRLPSQLSYSGGADVLVTKWLTAAFDIIGHQIFQAGHISTTTFLEPGACTDGNCISFKSGTVDTNLAQSNGTVNSVNASLGIKIQPFSSVLVSGNVLVKMNNGGLRTSVVPLLGVSYTF